MEKIYFTIYFFFTILILSSCNLPYFENEKNSRFEKNYSKEVDRINRERDLKNGNNAENFNDILTTPSQQNQITSNESNSFDYVDISHFGANKQEKYYPDYETYEFGKNSLPSNAFSPKIFEIGYNTYLNEPFSVSGVEFDYIDIPETDSFGVKSSSRDKNYTLVPIQSLQEAIRIINQTKNEDDIEFSKKLIVEKKNLLRKKNSLRNDEENEYTKFLNRSSEANNIKVAKEEFVNNKQNNIN